MTVGGLLGLMTLGGLLVLLVSEAALSIAPYVKQAAEAGLLEAARKAGLAGKQPEGDPAQIGDDRENPPDA